MKIGIVTTWFERGAAYVSKQFEEVWAENHQVFIYARGGESYAKGDPVWDKDNVTWGKRNLLSTPTSINLNHFEQWLKNNEIDLVLFNEQHEWGPVLACSKSNVITGAYIDYYKKETVPLFGAYDFLICNTKRHYSVFDWHPQAFYIPWGTDLKLFKPQENGTNGNHVRFFHSAGMNPLRKGTDLLIQAFEKIDRKQSQLIIHTQVDLHSFFPELGPLISQLTKEGSMKVMQQTVSAPGLYHLGDVYVYPSRLEGIGLTIAEAISCGLPAIVTNEHPMKEFVKNEKAGRLVAVNSKVKRGDNYFWPQSIVDIADLAQKMSGFVNERDRLNYIKNEAREYALKNLDWRLNLLSFEDALKRLQKLPNNIKQNKYGLALSYEKKRRFSYFLKSNRTSVFMKKQLKKLVR